MKISHRHNNSNCKLATEQDINSIILQLKQIYTDPTFDWDYALDINYKTKHFFYDYDDYDYAFDLTKKVKIEFAFTVVESCASILAYTDKYFNLICSSLNED